MDKNYKNTFESSESDRSIHAIENNHKIESYMHNFSYFFLSFFLCITLYFKRGSKKSENLNKSFVLNAFYRTSIVGSVPDLYFRHEWHWKINMSSAIKWNRSLFWNELQILRSLICFLWLTQNFCAKRSMQEASIE